MPANTRFAVALHILTLLAVKRGEAVTSDFIAGSVQTNAVVIRRILGFLREAGFVNAVQGPGGGFMLAVDPARLTLRQVYEAVEERSMFPVHAEGNRKCPVGRNIGAMLEQVVLAAEESMLKALAETTVAKIARRIEQCEKAS